MKLFANTKLVITDVDGVLTDGGFYYGNDGEIMKRFYVHDGLGIKMLMAAGIQVAVLSGGDSPILRSRIRDLGIPLFKLGKMDKREACRALIQEAGVTAEETIYIGDDTLDLPAFEICGTSVAVNDALEYIKRQADVVLTKKGGQGAFRELSDLILSAQGKAAIFETADGFIQHVHKMAQ